MYLKMFSCLDFCLNLFDIAGIHPLRGKWQYLRYVLTASLQLSVCSMVVMLLVGKKDKLSLEDFVGCIESTSLIMHGFFKTSSVVLKKSNLIKLMTMMKTEFWPIENIKDLNEREDYVTSLKFLRKVFFAHFSTCVIHMMTFGLRTWFSDQDYLPFESYAPEWMPFYFLYCYQNLMFFTGIFAPIVGMDLFILSTLLLTQIQFKMLNRELSRIFASEEAENFKPKIKMCVDHHNFLIRFVNHFNDTLDLIFLTYFVIIVLSMCVEMFIISTRDSFKYLMRSMTYMAAGFMEYIVCYCIPAQALTDQADKLSHSIYNSEWQKYISKPSTRMSVQTIMMIAQKGVSIKAKFITINMETCLNTVRTMVSYCMFLRTMGITS